MTKSQLSPWKRKSGVHGDDSQLRPLRGLQNEVDNIFENFFRDFNFAPSLRGWNENNLYSPNLDISETDKAYHLALELPGVDEKDIEVSISGDLLTIKGEKKLEEESKEKNYHRIERTYGSFQRSLSLPAEVDQNKVKADFKNGVLKIEIPKSEKTQPSVKKIDIKSS